jgi:hypothetical protein
MKPSYANVKEAPRFDRAVLNAVVVLQFAELVP